MTQIEQLYSQWQALQPLKQEDQSRLDQKFMLEFNYNSNHIEGNTLTYGQTEFLLLFGKTVDFASMKDLEDMKASNVGLKMMIEQAESDYPLTETFIRQLHKTILREDYEEYRSRGGHSFHYTVHAGIYKTRPNSVITPSGERFDYASPEETPALMTDLVNWYRQAEEERTYTLPELCAMFHYRYIRIHPFEDGNGRIARLLVNFILHRHHYPMIVVKSADKENYLKALSACDGFVGTTPSDGAHAEITEIAPFVEYIKMCMEQSLSLCIRAAKGLSIEEDGDFMKELRILERQKRQDIASEESQTRLNATEVWNVLEFVFFPIVQGFKTSINTANDVFRFNQIMVSTQMSKTKDLQNALAIDDVMRDTKNPQILDFVNNAGSMWYHCEIFNPTNPRTVYMHIDKKFYIAFFEDHYFVDGILNKNFPYGKYPSENEKRNIVSQFKKDILSELKESL